jgi:hypothetical protein
MSCAEIDALILLSLVMMWLDEATDPFHTAPGAFHTKLEFHVNGCGMEMGFTGSPPILAMVFFEMATYDVKNCDSAADVLHVARLRINTKNN